MLESTHFRTDKGSNTDITERKQSDERIRHLNSVLKSFVMVNDIMVNSRDQDRLLEDICRALTATRGYHNAWIMLLDEERRITDAAQAGVGDAFQDLLSRFRQGRMSPCACKALDSPQPQIVLDPQAECADCPLSCQYSGRAGFAVRLDVGGQPMGLLVVSVPKELAHDFEEHELFMNLAGTIAQGIRRIRLETIRRDQERRLLHYEQIICRINDPMSLVGEDYRYIVVNDAYTETFNKPRHEIEGCTVESLLGKDVFADKIKPRLDEALAGRKVVYEDCFPGLDGTPRYRIMSYYPFHDEKDGFKGVVSKAQDITERKRAEEAFQESEARFRQIYDHMAVGVAMISLDFCVEHANDAYCLMLGYDLHELVGKHIREFTHPEIVEENLLQQSRLAKGEIDHYRMEKAFIHKSGRVIHGILDACLVRDVKGNPNYFIGSVHDITERKRTEKEREKLQEQLAQVQKIESVGRLAGGVAHDFNNMLGVILGHTEMALDQTDPAQPVFSDLQEIRKAAQRSADLTRQLLTFARKQTIAPKVIDLNETVEGMLKMLRRLIGEDIHLIWLPGKNLLPVKMDPSQIDQILANLCVNARDAIAGVGKLTIETGAAVFDDAYCAVHAGFVPGEYVLLAVSDNGCGMDKEIVGRLFEPFFTTKEVGKGTGLGLASVYGAVRQNNGFINVYSEPGQGTTFRIYLPRHRAGTRVRTDTATAKPSVCGSETILLVEDEPAILRMAAMMLERLGYAVITAQTPGEAIRLAREHGGPIDLLMTDVVMPEMNGRDLAKNLLSIHPDIKRLFMSGYTANVIAHHGVLDEGVHFIQKPFSLKDLGEKLRVVLEC